MFSLTGQRTCILLMLTLQRAQSQMIFCGSAVFQCVLAMTLAVIFNRITVSLQTLGFVWGLGYKLSLGQNFKFLFLSVSFAPSSFPDYKKEKKRPFSSSSLSSIVLITPLSPSWQSLFFSSFLQRQSFLAIPLIIFTTSFKIPSISHVFSNAATRSGSIPYANSNIVTFSVLFLFYSPDTQISNVLFNHCCVCQEKDFIELSITISRYFSWAVTVHYIQQAGALLDSGFQGTVPSICQQ